MTSPAQIAAGRAIAPTGDYPTDFAEGFIQTRPVGASGQVGPAPGLGINCYVPPLGFPNWAAALKGIATGGIANAWILSASDGAGPSLTNPMTQTYWAIWRKRILLTYALFGDTFLPTYSSNYANNLTGVTQFPFIYDTAPASWAFSGPFTVPLHSGVGVALTSPAFHAVHPSTDLGYNARSCRVFYFDGGNQDGGAGFAGATFQYNTAPQVAGATTVTLNGDNLIHSFDITALPNSAGNAVYFGNQSAPSVIRIICVMWCPGTTISISGAHFAWFTQNGGFSMADLMRKDGQYPALRIERFMGPSNATAPFTPAAALSPPFAPHLVFEDELDDLVYVGTTSLAGVTPATLAVSGAAPGPYLHGLRRITETLTANKGCDVVQVIDPTPSELVSDLSSITAFQTWNGGHYTHMRKQWAELNQQGWLNLNSEFGQLLNTNGWSVSGTDPHMSAKAHAQIANVLLPQRLGL